MKLIYCFMKTPNRGENILLAFYDAHHLVEQSRNIEVLQRQFSHERLKRSA